MDFTWTPDSIKSLQNLLTPTEDASDDEQGTPTAPKFTPGDIGSKKKKKNVSKPEIKPVDPNAIWEVDEVPEVEDVQDIYDPRPQPEYEILFKQDVTTEDIYLQMGNKTPTTASCEYMVIRVKLPSTSMDQIKLDIKEQFWTCEHHYINSAYIYQTPSDRTHPRLNGTLNDQFWN